MYIITYRTTGIQDIVSYMQTYIYILCAKEQTSAQLSAFKKTTKVIGKSSLERNWSYWTLI